MDKRNIEFLHVLISSEDNVPMMIKFIEEHGSEKLCEEYDGMNAMHRAVENDHHNTVLYFSSKMPVNLISSKTFETPLDLAIRVSAKNSVRTLVTKACNVTRPLIDPPYWVNVFYNDIKCFHQSCMDALSSEGLFDLIQKFPSVLTLEGVKPLLPQIIEHGRVDVVKSVVTHYRQLLTVPCCNGRTPLAYCVLRKKKNMVEALIEEGADMEEKIDKRFDLRYVTAINFN